MNETVTHPVDPLLPKSRTQQMKALLGDLREYDKRANYRHERETPNPAPIDPGKRPGEQGIDPGNKQSPYEADVEQACSECGGTGIDPGGLQEYEPETCTVCHGTRKEVVHRQWLSEAFAIAEDRSLMLPERAHLKAFHRHIGVLTEECNQHKSASIAADVMITGMTREL